MLLQSHTHVKNESKNIFISRKNETKKKNKKKVNKKTGR